jgi:chorismate mutase
MALRAIRGAIQVPANTAGDIASGVQELIAAILKANELTPSEVAVPGALDKTVRAMLHVETARTPEQITHIYLHGAASLRRDIAQ